MGDVLAIGLGIIWLAMLAVAVNPKNKTGSIVSSLGQTFDGSLQIAEQG